MFRTDSPGLLQPVRPGPAGDVVSRPGVHRHHRRPATVRLGIGDQFIPCDDEDSVHAAAKVRRRTELQPAGADGHVRERRREDWNVPVCGSLQLAAVSAKAGAPIRLGSGAPQASKVLAVVRGRSQFMSAPRRRSRSSRAAFQRSPSSGRHSIGVVELAREVRLIGKAAIDRRVRELRARCELLARPLQAAHQLEAIRTDPERTAKLPGQLPPAQVRNCLQLRCGYPFAL